MTEPLTPSQQVLRKELDLKARLDSWASALTGLGGVRDKTTSVGFGKSALLTPDTLDDLYTSDDMAATIVEAVIEDALSEGMEVQGDESGDVARLLRQHDAVEELAQAAIWGRLFGGGALFMGCKDADQAAPLGEDHGPLLYTMVLDRREMTPRTYYTDPTEQEFGRARTYTISPMDTSAQAISGKEVHESRLLFFGGARTTKTQRSRNGGWDTSVLQRAYDTLRDASANWRSAVHAMADLSQSVYMIEGLVDMIAEGKKDDMLARMELTDMARSVARAVVVDAELEDFKTVGSANLSAVPSLLDIGFVRVAAAARMPVTRLMGKSPAGLNATGESDLEQWYRQVEVFRELILRPQALRLVKVVARTLGQPTDDLDVTFPPLWSMSEAETAALRKSVAETDQIYVNMGALLPEEVMLSRFGGDGYSMDTTVDLALDREQFMPVAPAPAPEPAPPEVPAAEPPAPPEV